MPGCAGLESGWAGVLDTGSGSARLEALRFAALRFVEKKGAIAFLLLRPREPGEGYDSGTAASRASRGTMGLPAPLTEAMGARQACWADDGMRAGALGVEHADSRQDNSDVALRAEG